MLTDAIVKSLEPKPDKKTGRVPHQRIETDHKPGDDTGKTCRGFGVKVMASGTKTFVVAYRFKGREKEFVIGKCTEWKCGAARQKAREVRQSAQNGIDPQAVREADRKAPTVADLVAFYREEFLPAKKPRGQVEDNSILEQWILHDRGLGRRRRLADITNADARALHRKISKETPVRANRVVDLARHLWNLASDEKDGWVVTGNPFRGVQRNHEDPRERYLDDETEIKRLQDALDQYADRQAANLIQFIIYTGCRRGEAMAARWDQFNEGRRIWTKPSAHTKQQRTHRVALSTMAISLLGEIWETAAAEVERYNKGRSVGRPKRVMSEFVFPSDRSASGHIEEIKQHWKAIRDKAEIADVRVHDLRHSYASMLVNQGIPLQMVGQLLGHTQLATTKRYAHLNDKAMMKAVETLGNVLPLRKSGC
jgi:integrase